MDKIMLYYYYRYKHDDTVIAVLRYGRENLWRKIGFFFILIQQTYVVQYTMSYHIVLIQSTYICQVISCFTCSAQVYHYRGEALKSEKSTSLIHISFCVHYKQICKFSIPIHLEIHLDLFYQFMILVLQTLVFTEHAQPLDRPTRALAIRDTVGQRVQVRV